MRTLLITNKVLDQFYLKDSYDIGISLSGVEQIWRIENFVATGEELEAICSACFV